MNKYILFLYSSNILIRGIFLIYAQSKHIIICQNHTGVGLGAILFGPTVMSVIGLIVLIFQAVLLAHGGITTLGANTFSMAVIGPLVSFFLYKLLKK